MASKKVKINPEDIPRAERCSTCNGKGHYFFKGENARCSWCSGTGRRLNQG